MQAKHLISLLFCFLGAFLSAFLDALTVIIAMAYAFYNVYHRYVSGTGMYESHDLASDGKLQELQQEKPMQFREFLRNLTTHGAGGTALGGVSTLVDEPQNLVIAGGTGWTLTTFFLKVAQVSMPVLVVGLCTCFLVERFPVCAMVCSRPARS